MSSGLSVNFQTSMIVSISPVETMARATMASIVIRAAAKWDISEVTVKPVSNPPPPPATQKALYEDILLVVFPGGRLYSIKASALHLVVHSTFLGHY